MNHVIFIKRKDYVKNYHWSNAEEAENDTRVIVYHQQLEEKFSDILRALCEMIESSKSNNKQISRLTMPCKLDLKLASFGSKRDDTVEEKMKMWV